MADGKVTCKVVFEKYDWSREGYRELLNSSTVQKKVKEIATGIQTRAGDMAGDTTLYDSAPRQMKFAKGYIVHPDSAEAFFKEKKHNYLRKAVRKQ